MDTLQFSDTKTKDRDKKQNKIVEERRNRKGEGGEKWWENTARAKADAVQSSEFSLQT